jgi:hypothetical protein
VPLDNSIASKHETAQSCSEENKNHKIMTLAEKL